MHLLCQVKARCEARTRPERDVSISVLLLLPDGRAEALSWPTDASLDSLRGVAGTLLGCDPTTLRVKCSAGGAKVRDGATLRALGVRDWATIEVMGMLLGGMLTGKEGGGERRCEGEEGVQVSEQDSRWCHEHAVTFLNAGAVDRGCS